MRRIACALVITVMATVSTLSSNALAASTFSKTANPSSGAAPLTVVYTYTFDNTQGNQALSSVDTPSDNTCSPVVSTGGDANHNNILDIGEIWTWTCTATVSATTQNTAQTSARWTTCQSPDICTLHILDFITATATVSILPPPLAVSISGNSSACQNDQVTLTAVPTGGTPPYTFAWTTGATSQTITPSTSTAGSFTFGVTVTDKSGTTASASATLTVTLVCKTDIDKPVLRRPQLPLLTTIEWGCGWSFAGACLSQTIVKICVGGQCIVNPTSPRPPICSGIVCGGLLGLGVGAVGGLIAGMLLQRARRRE